MTPHTSILAVIHVHGTSLKLSVMFFYRVQIFSASRRSRSTRTVGLRDNQTADEYIRRPFVAVWWKLSAYRFCYFWCYILRSSL